MALKFRMLILPALLLAVSPSPEAAADEIEDSIEAALEAYLAGDIKLAKEELDFAAQLMAQLKAEGLSGFLPEPLSGWDRQDEDTTQSASAFGGGLMAQANYSNGSERVEIQLMADNQIVTAMGAMFSNAALMGAMGKVKRINREKVVITNQGELQTLINNRIMIQISGSADVEVKEAYFAAIDIEGLKDF